MKVELKVIDKVHGHGMKRVIFLSSRKLWRGVFLVACRVVCAKEHGQYHVE